MDEYSHRTSSPRAVSGDTRRSYDALISYNADTDGAISRELRRRLIRFAKPFWRLRAVRVYRYSESGVPSPDLHEVGVKA